MLIARLGFVQLCRCHISTLQYLLSKQQAARQQLFVCFLDMEAAYDRVSRPLLWDVLRHLGIHGALLQLCRLCTALSLLQLGWAAGKGLRSSH